MADSHEESPPMPGMRPVTTKIRCRCGYQASNWLEFHRHRGDSYREWEVIAEVLEHALRKANPVSPALVRPEAKRERDGS